MSNELIVSVRNSRRGREATPWLEPFRGKFRLATRAASEQLKNDPSLQGLDGPTRVRIMHSLVSQILKGER